MVCPVASRIRRAAGKQWGGDFLIVIPAKAGIHAGTGTAADQWIPAFAGMTGRAAAYVGAT
jgi:hypothetical protein